MKNLPIIIISLILIIGASITLFLNLPKNNDITEDKTFETNSVNTDSELNPIDQKNDQASNDNTSFTLEEVATHNTKDDCYLIIRKNVYDVSNFIDSHPGGTQQISEKCGQEVTGIFAQIHSNKAWDLLIDYKIGTLQN